MKNQSLLHGALSLIFISIFNFSDPNSGVIFNGVQLYARILPLTITPFLIFFSMPKEKRISSLLYFFKMPYLIITWYSFVAIVSGFVSNIQPLWGLWKQYELLLTIYFFSAVSIIIKSNPAILKQLLNTLCFLCFLMMSWSMYHTIIVEGVDLAAYFVLRLGTNYPIINAIQLSAICSFGLVYVFSRLFELKKLSVLELVYYVACLVVFAAVFVASKSRTGILALFLVTAFYLLSNTTKVSTKIKIVVVSLLIGFSVNKEALTLLRIGDATELATGGGRFSSGYAINPEDAAWPETISFIKRKIVFGYGCINITRFISDKKFAVDNFALQALISSGIVGSIAYILYFLIYPLLWTKILFKKIIDKKLLLVALVCLFVGFSRGISTNDLAYNGFGFISFLFSIVYFYNFDIIEPHASRRGKSKQQLA